MAMGYVGFSRFDIEHIQLRRQAHEASRNVIHDDGAVIRSREYASLLSDIFSERAALISTQHDIDSPCDKRARCGHAGSGSKTTRPLTTTT